MYMNDHMVEWKHKSISSMDGDFTNQELECQDSNFNEELETKIEINDEPVLDCFDFKMYVNDHEVEWKATNSLERTQVTFELGDFVKQEFECGRRQDANSNEELEGKIEINDRPVLDVDCSDFKMYVNDHEVEWKAANPLEQAQECVPFVSNDFANQEFLCFVQQELAEQGANFDEGEGKTASPSLPKEIDSTSALFTNIITNYTPPQNEGGYKCPKCFKGFHKKTLLKKHKNKCRPRLKKNLLTRCMTCSRFFKDRQSLTKHLINYHSDYACEICGQKVQSKCEIVSHIRFSHPNCHLFCHCGNILRSKLDLVEHKKDHRNSFVCQFCADMLPTKIKLTMHILSLHSKILSLSCGICLKLFETQHILRDHVRIVHKDQLLPLTSCTVCGKNYRSKWKTYNHLNKSHGRIFKVCKSCLEVFDTEMELQKHFKSAHRGQVKAVALKPTASAEENRDSRESNDSFAADQCEDEQVPNPNWTQTRISLWDKLLKGHDSLLPSVMKDKSKQPGKKVWRKKTVQPSDLDWSLQKNPKRLVYMNIIGPSSCEVCLKTWPGKKHLWQHYIYRHKTVAATVCGICLKTNDNYKALQTHLWENHPKLLHGQGFGSNFICKICGRYHNASSKLRLHLPIHEKFEWPILDA